MGRKWRVLTALLLGFTLVAGACGSDDEEAAPAATTRTLRIATIQEVATMDAHLVGTKADDDVFVNIFEQLVDLNPDGSLFPVLASELPENVEDNRWRVQLREGVTFSNGEAFDADAVVLNVERMIDPELGSVHFDNISAIVGIERVDDFTVDILTDGFDVVLPKRLWYIRMIAPSSIQAETLNDEAFGTGPYVVKSWDRATSITLEANDEYWGDQPQVREVKVVFLPDPGTRLAALLSGEVEIITGLAPDDAERVPQFVTSSDRAVLMGSPTCEPGRVTNDLRVRQAMLHSIDRESIVRDLYGGDATAIHGVPVDPSWFGYDADVSTYEYDPERAKALIEEADAVGGHVSIVFWADRWPRLAEVTQVLQAAWEDIGLDVELLNKAGSAYGDALKGRAERPELVMVETANEFFDASLVSGKFLAPGAARATCPAVAPELTPLLDAAINTSDGQERLRLYSEIFEIASANAISIPIVAGPIETIGMASSVSWQPGLQGITRVFDMSLSE